MEFYLSNECISVSELFTRIKDLFKLELDKLDIELKIILSQTDLLIKADLELLVEVVDMGLM